MGEDAGGTWCDKSGATLHHQGLGDNSREQPSNSDSLLKLATLDDPRPSESLGSGHGA